MVLVKGALVPKPLSLLWLGGGKHACLHLVGPDSGLPVARDYRRGVWLPKSGLNPRKAEPCELYHNTPTDTPPEALWAEIRLPVA